MFNNGNWGEVEEAVQARAKQRRSNVQVFTKVVLKVRGKMLWLVKDSIPVPEYLWKLLVDFSSGDGIVFVTGCVTLCKYVCDQVWWGAKLKDREVI